MKQTGFYHIRYSHWPIIWTLGAIRLVRNTTWPELLVYNENSQNLLSKQQWLQYPKLLEETTDPHAFTTLETRMRVMAYLSQWCTVGTYTSKCIDDPVNQSGCCTVPDIRSGIVV